nr:putative transposase [Ipomoea batatas]
MNATSAIKLRLVRTYEVPERRGATTMKGKNCVFHDQEGTVLHCTIPRDLVQKYSTSSRPDQTRLDSSYPVGSKQVTQQTSAKLKREQVLHLIPFQVEDVLSPASSAALSSLATAASFVVSSLFSAFSSAFSSSTLNFSSSPAAAEASLFSSFFFCDSAIS